MCACRVEEMKSTRSAYDLEDYIYEMESRANYDTTPDGEDVYAQLAQKEKDLILAAELGKALLEKNQELSQSNEKMLDDFNLKMEQLEQEKHALRRKLDAVEGEYESKVLELQSDVHLLRKELDQQQTTMAQGDREKAQIINELTEQNQRLTTQLKQASHTEEQLSSQLKYLKEQFTLRKTNMHDHVSQLEMLREEINIITEKKMELERRIESLSDERDQMAAVLEESTDRIILLEKHNKDQDQQKFIVELERRIESLSDERDQMAAVLEESTDRIILLEKHNKDQDQQVRNNERDLEELRLTNMQLQERVEVLSRRSSTPPSLCHTSLLNEIEMSEEDDMRSFNSSSQSRHQSQLIAMGLGNDIDDEEDIECDDSELSVHFPPVENEELNTLRQEVLDVYQQLRLMCEQLRHRRKPLSSSASTSSEEMGASKVKLGMLTDVLKDLRGLLHDILRRDAKGMCLNCGQGPAEREELEKELSVTKENLERLQRTLTNKNDELKHKSETVMDLTSKLNVRQAELHAMQEERDILRNDLENTHLSQDEIVTKAWHVRDQALSRKNHLEVDLARTRIEVMNTNSQLIEAIQQKLELSQQLEQWQVDMESLLEDQMKKKLSQERSPTEDSDAAGSSSSQSSSTPRKFFKLWR